MLGDSLIPWESYPFAPRPADLDTNPSSAWSSQPDTLQVLGPKTAEEANKAFVFTQPSDPTLGLNLQAREPGRMPVLIDVRDVIGRDRRLAC
jgi:hypothetical protein